MMLMLELGQKISSSSSSRMMPKARYTHKWSKKLPLFVVCYLHSWPCTPLLPSLHVHVNSVKVKRQNEIDVESEMLIGIEKYTLDEKFQYAYQTDGIYLKSSAIYRYRGCVILSRIFPKINNKYDNIVQLPHTNTNR